MPRRGRQGRSSAGAPGPLPPGGSRVMIRGSPPAPPTDLRRLNMDLPRRSFLRTTLGAAALLAGARRGAADEVRRVTRERLAEVAAAPVLRVDGLEEPVTIASME